MDYEDFWTLVYDVQDDLKIKAAAKKLHPIQVEEIIAHLAREMNRLRIENAKKRRLLSTVIILDRKIIIVNLRDCRG